MRRMEVPGQDITVAPSGDVYKGLTCRVDDAIPCWLCHRLNCPTSRGAVLGLHPGMRGFGFPTVRLQPPKLLSETGFPGGGKLSCPMELRVPWGETTMLQLGKFKVCFSGTAFKNIFWWRSFWTRLAQGDFFSSYQGIILQLFVFGFYVCLSLWTLTNQIISSRVKRAVFVIFEEMLA